MARPSHVRDSVRSLLESSDRHDWSIEDLHAEIRARGLSADYSSVFRAVNWLERQGIIGQVSLGDSRVHYEIAGRHHDHVRCDECGAVSSLPDCLLKRTEARVEKGTGFAVTGHHLVFSGLCPACR
jgi:Fur family transcriptional regulator, ferric uptake regulator